MQEYTPQDIIEKIHDNSDTIIALGKKGFEGWYEFCKWQNEYGILYYLDADYKLAIRKQLIAYFAANETEKDLSVNELFYGMLENMKDEVHDIDQVNEKE